MAIDGNVTREAGETVTLKEHIEAVLAAKELRDEQRYTALQTLMATELSAAEKAVHKSETSIERRFEAVNEFRATLSDQAAHFVTRSELEVLRQQWRESTETLAARLDKSEGRSMGITSGWGYLIGAVTLAGTVIAAIFALTH